MPRDPETDIDIAVFVPFNGGGLLQSTAVFLLDAWCQKRRSPAREHRASFRLQRISGRAP